MKPSEVAFIAVVVIFRTASLASVLFGLFITAMPLLGFVGNFSTQVLLGLLRILVVYLAAGGVLWIAAKPAASLAPVAWRVMSGKSDGLQPLMRPLRYSINVTLGGLLRSPRVRLGRGGAAL